MNVRLPGFWNYNYVHEPFKSTREPFPIAFIPGNIFLLSLPEHGPLKTLTSLTPFRHRIFAVHASAFSPLFSEERQLALARRLAVLLFPEPGSIIFGQGLVSRHAHQGYPPFPGQIIAWFVILQRAGGRYGWKRFSTPQDVRLSLEAEVV